MWRSLRFALVLGVAVACAQPLAAGPPNAKDDGLEQAFQKANQQLRALAPKHAVLKGLTEVKPQVERDAKGLKQASFKFARNTAPLQGKPPPQAKDASQPHFYLTVSLWRGEPSRQPPPGIRHFRVGGADYYLIVTVSGSDAGLSRQVRLVFEQAFSAWLGPQAQSPAKLPGSPR